MRLRSRLGYPYGRRTSPNVAQCREYGRTLLAAPHVDADVAHEREVLPHLSRQTQARYCAVTPDIDALGLKRARRSSTRDLRIEGLLGKSAVASAVLGPATTLRVPRQTTAPRHRVLSGRHAEIVKAMNPDDVRAKLAAHGFDAGSRTPEQFGAFRKAGEVRRGRVLKQAGISPE